MAGKEDIIAKMFPLIFTAVSVLVFMVPAFTLLYIARQPAVDFFMNDKSFAVLVIPFVIVLAHWWHVKYGPTKYATPLAVLIPIITLGVTGNLTQTGSSKYVQSLFSVDCDILPEKAHLQLEWEAAAQFFKKCVNDTTAKSSFNSEYLAKNFRIQDCTDYEPVFAKHSETWGYLQRLEENYACTGFCVPGQQLWSKGPHKDSCSVAVSMIFENFVSARSGRIFNMMLVLLIMTAIYFVFLAPNIHSTDKL